MRCRETKDAGIAALHINLSVIFVNWHPMKTTRWMKTSLKTEHHTWQMHLYAVLHVHSRVLTLAPTDDQDVTQTKHRRV